MDFHDRAPLEKVRRLSTGELAASVRCARTGTQDYTGAEVGKPELARVTVYRPETEVMKRDSIASFAGVPVTIDHPNETVTTDNWKRYAVGEAGDEVLRDGEFIRVPILVRDAAAIRAIEDGKRCISMGYSCSVEFVDGVTPKGERYQAIQRDLRMNHCALVDQARGGPELRIGDAALADSGKVVRDIARMAQFGAHPAAPSASGAKMQDAASIQSQRATRDAARSAQY